MTKDIRPVRLRRQGIGIVVVVMLSSPLQGQRIFVWLFYEGQPVAPTLSLAYLELSPLGRSYCQSFNVNVNCPWWQVTWKRLESASLLTVW